MSTENIFTGKRITTFDRGTWKALSCLQGNSYECHERRNLSFCHQLLKFYIFPVTDAVEFRQTKGTKIFSMWLDTSASLQQSKQIMNIKVKDINEI